MNYENIYIQIIEKVKSKNRKKLNKNDKDYIYYERHHIIPRCLGGENDKENLILLTAKEHFICHKLLVEMFPNNKKLIYSLLMMSNCKNDNKYNERCYRISSNEYERFKIERSKLASERFSGEGNPMYGSKRVGELNPNFGNILSEESKDKIRIKAIGRKHSTKTMEKLYKIAESKRGKPGPNLGKSLSEETKKKISDNSPRLSGENHPMWGKTHSEESKKKMSESRKGENSHMFGVPKSEETKQKLSESHKNRERVTCPHCNKTLDISNAKRWHFDNCLENPDNNKEELLKFRKENSPTFNKKFLKEIKYKLSNTAKNRERVICPYCGKELDISNAKRWHFDNCKHK